MASSSNSHKTLKSSSSKNEEIKASKIGEQEEDWLDLGLGLGLGTTCRKIGGHRSNPVSDSPSSSTSRLQMPINFDKVGSGLGLGFERSSGLGPKKMDSRDAVDMEPPGGSDDDNRNRLLGRSDHCPNHHNIHSGMGLLSSWQMGSRQEWDMVVPSVSHHDLARKTNDAGLWFTLRSSTNQNGEALPQIPKAYIRVNDQNVTVFMVKKYLVTKLGLSNEAEIDIWCMGRSLSQTQTLKEVRDSVWIPAVMGSVKSLGVGGVSVYHPGWVIVLGEVMISTHQIHRCTIDLYC